MKSLTIAAVFLMTSVILATTSSGQDKSDFNNHTEATRLRQTGQSSDKSSSRVSSDSSKPVAANLKPVKATSATAPPANKVTALSPSPDAIVATQVYRVGVRDVLDIQLTNNPSRDSTLFTVLDGGVLDYPFAGDPIVVAGLTTREIAVRLQQRIKVFDNPTVLVNVRDYASHTVTITGFVAAPGKKALRREAVPLYTILAEAQLLPDATRATVTRRGHAPFVVELKYANPSSTLIMPGDAIKVSSIPADATEFFFIGGEIHSPGQKAYHPGLTLTQAILASGGTNPRAGSQVKVSRQGLDGRLTAVQYNLRNIQTGRLPDPALQKGDRIEVTRAN